VSHSPAFPNPEQLANAELEEESGGAKGVVALIKVESVKQKFQNVAFCGGLFHPLRVTEPLALVLYEKLLPGSQLVNRLQDLKYRVQSLTDPALLVESAEQTKPLIVLADLESTKNDVLTALGRLRQNPATAHLPIVAFARENATGYESAAQQAGVTICVKDSALLNHLPQILDQALDLE
jgi:CheY-like chemotaxis protein